MKMKHLIAFGVASYAAYQAVQLYQQRDQVKASFHDTEETLSKMLIDKDAIQKNLAVIAHERQKLQDVSQDLTHKFRVFSQETQAHLAQINNVMTPYKENSSH